ncbi:MAG: Glycosyltransferase [Candidatus Wolfebacteria bacterium GW2011_GWE2_44_13]|uniref:Glycosyltransferase n=1 Tax=Candidatus Wolfebacteria bacterium GW2011_GWE2_44_13 TaxID=1619017 RepID=A0A0G1JHQ9_9BACT|nr:MAG: Glycosyltransferase [Candidatus Wolfebacteria bacterium GW2011_GWE2_44_13]
MGTLFGGGENFDLNLAQALAQQGHHVRFVIGKSYRSIARMPKEANNFDVIYAPFFYTAWMEDKVRGYGFFSKVLASLVINFDYRSFELSAYSKLRKDAWADVYYVCGLPLLGAALNAKAPTMVRWPGIPSKVSRRFLNWYDANMAGGDVYPRISGMCKKIFKIDPGVDVDFFAPAKAKSLKNTVDFLFVGRMSRIKNVSFLLEGFACAAAERKNIRLHLVGSGDEKAGLLNLAKKLRLDAVVTFYPHAYKKDLLKLYQMADVFTIVSTYDNFPNVVLEAMACELPVIGTSVGGIPTQIQEGENGFLISSNDVDALKEKLIYFADNKAKIDEMGIAARKFVEDTFKWEVVAKKVEEEFRALIKERV